MLQEFIGLLLQSDSNFQKYWGKCSEKLRNEFLVLGYQIESVGFSDSLGENYVVDVLRELSRYMVRIQDIPFDYKRIPPDWVDIVRDARAKEELYDYANKELLGFLASCCDNMRIKFYGGIKSEESLMRRLTRPKNQDQFRKVLLDTWDVVRFRIVVPDICVLRDIALSVWEGYFSRVLRCRNYYYHPKDHNRMDPYRAVHFEIEISEGRIIELQLMTYARELVCFLDHAPNFKRSVSVFNSIQLKWLNNISLKSNIYDYNHTIKQR
jgi:hypothetical protein